ncbi:MAG: hypothetical protein WC453_00970 [Patescibacteria group bacterium]
MDKPYVVSADIHLLLQEWAKQKGLILPPSAFFTQLRREMVAKLEKIFGRVELVGEERLRQGFNDLLKDNGLPVISLDRIYVATEYNLEVTRIVDSNGRDLGSQNRAGTPNLDNQLRLIKDSLSQGANTREVVLADDVIFSGDLLLKAVDLLKKVDIKVVKVFAGIGITEGVEKIEARNIPVKCVCEYSEVIDEVCERDFYPGVPLSGRLVAGTENIGSPYLLPFGKQKKWASIPEEYQVDFSQFCWRQTILLFSAIEHYSQRVVYCSDLGRLIVNLPTNGTRFVDAAADTLKLEMQPEVEV